MFCCNRCVQYNNCPKKWILGERGLPQTCCFECSDFHECFDGNMKNRWKIIHKVEGEVMVDRDKAVEVETANLVEW